MYKEFDNDRHRPKEAARTPASVPRSLGRHAADPVNALLSYAYTLLVRSWTVALSAVGFDPYQGFYHQPRYGRPSLALDLIDGLIHHREDHVVIMDVGPADKVSPRVVSLGKDFQPVAREPVIV